jgi:hypothetical protein
LFLLSRSIWWCADHDHMELSHPPYTRNAPVSWKLLISPYIYHIYFCFFCDRKCEVMTKNGSLMDIPLKQEVPNYL